MPQNPIAQIVPQPSEIRQAVLDPVVDNVGKAIEEGFNAVLGTTPTPIDPVAQAEKQKADQEKIAYINNYFDQLAAADKARLAQANAKKQQEAQLEAQKSQEKHIEISQKEQNKNVALENERRKTEAKPGQGGG